MKYAIVKVHIPNKKGIELATEIYRPEASGKLPVVLFFHGFTGYKEESGLVDLASKLSEKGFVTVRFTASGLGDSGGVLEKDYRFTSHRKDAEAILRHIFNLSYIDRGRCGVYGHSMGGKLAVLFVEKAYRGQGIGKQLLAEAEKRLRSKSVRSYSLLVDIKNPKALKFYQREGLYTGYQFYLMTKELKREAA